MRKIILCFICGAFAMGLASCMQEDNFDAPAASIRGNIIAVDPSSHAGKMETAPLLTTVNEVRIRIWERSWSDNPTQQDLNVKDDASYLNTKLFAGTYNMLPNEGPWWPCDTLYDVPIGNKNNATQDFEVVPYLYIKDFKCETIIAEDPAAMDTIVMSGRLYAPVTEGLPNIQEVRPFLNLNNHCGNSNKIDFYYSDNMRFNLRTAWVNIGDMDTGEGYETYEFRIPVKKGYTYWCRMGANVNDTYKIFNYSRIEKVELPQ